MKESNAKEFKKARRAYSRSNSNKRPTQTENLVRVYGYKMAYLVEQFERYRNELVSTHIHVRINYRAKAITLYSFQDWLSNAKRLTLTWRYFDTTKEYN